MQFLQLKTDKSFHIVLINMIRNTFYYGLLGQLGELCLCRGNQHIVQKLIYIINVGMPQNQLGEEINGTRLSGRYFCR